MTQNKIRNGSDGTDYDVVIIGGGVIGCASARALSDDHDVIVLEKGQIAGEASGLAAGNIRPTMVYSEHPAAAKFANSYFRELDGVGAYEFTERPRLEFVSMDNIPEAKVHILDLMSEDFPVSLLTPEELGEKYPYFEIADFGGAVEYQDTGWVDPYTYTITLKNEAEALGAKFETGVEVSEIIEQDGQVRGVKTNDGDIASDHVVVAAGWRTTQLVESHVSLPVRPFLTQCVVLEPPMELGETFPIGRAPSKGLYFRPEHNGDLLVGGGHRDISEPEEGSNGTSVDEEFKLEVTSTLPELFTGFEKSRLVDGWAGVDGITPDKRAIIDLPNESPEGLIIATGFSGGGVRDSPLAAVGVRSLVTDEPCPIPLEMFSLNRFKDYNSEFNVVETLGKEVLTE